MCDRACNERRYSSKDIVPMINDQTVKSKDYNRKGEALMSMDIWITNKTRICE